MKRYIWEAFPEISKSEIEYYRNEFEEFKNAADEEIEEWFLSCQNLDCLDDERNNLNRELPGNILVIGDLGLWYGRRQGYRILGNNLNSFFSVSSGSFWGDGYNIRSEEAHHDGTNHYLFRLIRPEKNPRPLLDAICSGKTISLAMLNRYTKSLYPYVASVYGWPCRWKVVD